MLASGGAAAAAGGTPGHGVLYFTTYQNQGYCTTNCTPNVYKVNWSYDGATTFTLSPSVSSAVYAYGSVLSTTKGADGILFTPAGTNLLVAGQEANQIYDINPQTGAIVNSSSVGKNAYHMVVDPSGTAVWTFGQQGDHPAAPAKVPLPINSSTPGTVYSVYTANEATYGLTQIAFVPASKVGLKLSPSPLLYEGQYIMFYTASPDVGGGDFGYLAPGPNADSFLAIPLTSKPWTHGLIYDHYTGDLIATGADQIAQIDVSGTSLNVTAFTAPAGTNGTPEFDQAETDGAGHLFVADNHGDIYFMDYSVNKSVGSPGYFTHVFLANNLDDVVNQLPEVPFAIGLPAMLLGAGLLMARRRRRTQKQ